MTGHDAPVCHWNQRGDFVAAALGLLTRREVTTVDNLRMQTITKVILKFFEAFLPEGGASDARVRPKLVGDPVARQSPRPKRSARRQTEHQKTHAP